MCSGFRRGVSGSRRWSERAANAIHSRSGVRAEKFCPRPRQVSCTEADMRDCHSSNVCQDDCNERTIPSSK